MPFDGKSDVALSILTIYSSTILHVTLFDGRSQFTRILVVTLYVSNIIYIMQLNGRSLVTLTSIFMFNTLLQHYTICYTIC